MRRIVRRRRRNPSLKARLPAMDITLRPKRGTARQIRPLLKGHGFKRAKGGSYKLHMPPMSMSVRTRANPSIYAQDVRPGDTLQIEGLGREHVIEGPFRSGRGIRFVDQYGNGVMLKPGEIVKVVARSNPSREYDIDSLYERAAEKLGWSVKDAKSFSLPMLREIVREKYPKLAHEISLAIASGSHVYGRKLPRSRRNPVRKAIKRRGVTKSRTVRADEVRRGDRIRVPSHRGMPSLVPVFTVSAVEKAGRCHVYLVGSDRGLQVTHGMRSSAKVKIISRSARGAAKRANPRKRRKAKPRSRR